MMKTPELHLITTTVLILMLIGTAITQDSPKMDYKQGIDLHPHVTKFLDGELAPVSEAFSRVSQRNGTNLSLVSFLSLPDHPVSDVWAHGDYAYVGGWGPNTQGYVVDIKRPSDPIVVATIEPMADGTSPQDLKAGKINTPHFKGDILIVGNDGFEGGFQIFNVNDPTAPQLLGEYHEPFVHNLYLYQRQHRAYLLVAVPTREVGYHCCPDLVSSPGELLIVDITDPTSPELVGEWAAGADGGFGSGFEFFPVPPGSECTACRGIFPGALLHDVWANKQGTVAYLSYWDLGLILLDISDPTEPTLISQTTEPMSLGSDEGDCHVAVPANGGNLVLVGDEVFGTQPWGFLRIFDTSDPFNPVQISTFATPNTLTNEDNDLWTSMHNVIVRGNRAYISWYNEGIRVVDFSDPYNPYEVASFQAPEGTTDPSLMWGVYVHESLILASDVSGGLFILELPNNGNLNAPFANQIATEARDIDIHLYPNPSANEVHFMFTTEAAQELTFNIYDASGKLIYSRNSRGYPAGAQTITWNGRGSSGSPVSSGIYLCTLENSNGIVGQRKLMRH